MLPVPRQLRCQRITIQCSSRPRSFVHAALHIGALCAPGGLPEARVNGVHLHTQQAQHNKTRAGCLRNMSRMAEVCRRRCAGSFSQLWMNREHILPRQRHQMVTCTTQHGTMIRASQAPTLASLLIKRTPRQRCVLRSALRRIMEAEQSSLRW